MTTSNSPTNPEKKEEKAPADQVVSLRGLLEKFTINLSQITDETNHPIPIPLFPPNPRFNGVVESIFNPPFNPGTEWHFIQKLYQLSLKSSDDLQGEIKTLLDTYISADSPSSLDLSAAMRAKIMENAQAEGLNSFLPILQEQLGSGYFSQQLANNIAQNNKLSAENTDKLRVALGQDKHDKSMLPIRTVICHALQRIEDQKIFSAKTTTRDKFDKFFKKMTRPDRVNTLIEQSEKDMRGIQIELDNLLKASANPNTKPESLQKLFQEIMKAQGKLIETHIKLAKELGPYHPHVQKIHAFSEILSIAKYENNPATTAAIETPTNTALVQKYMEPIEKQKQKEAVEKKEAENAKVAPLSPNKR